MAMDTPENASVVKTVAEMMLGPAQSEIAKDCVVSNGVNLPNALEEGELKGIVEALLYVSEEPLTLDKLTDVLEGPPKGVVHNVVRSLQQDYDQEGRGLRIADLAGGFVMVTRPDCAPWITRFKKVKASAKASRSALETLAIVAYKQPIVRTEIEQIRGVETSGVLRTLLDQKLIRIVGRKNDPGRPIMYGTSKTFLERFGLRDLRDLPSLREFKELSLGEDPNLFNEESLAINEDVPLSIEVPIEEQEHTGQPAVVQ